MGKASTLETPYNSRHPFVESSTEFLKVGYIGDYIGENHRVRGDTRSLDLDPKPSALL